MRRASRRFDIFVIGMDDVERLGAWKTKQEVSFTYRESRSLQRVRKRNTFLFDALADMLGRPYRVSEGVLEDMLYEVVMVDFHTTGHVRCLNPGDPNLPGILPATELEKTLYEHGFCITGPDGKDIHFVPFIASASMAREEAYLFVNRERLDGLLRAASLDMISADPEMYVPVLNGEPAKQPADAVFGGLNRSIAVANVPKLAAYMGLALSDGVSLRERWAAQHEGELPELNDAQWAAEWMLGLNEHNTVCVGEWTDAPMQLDKFEYCWINGEAPRMAKALPSERSSTQTDTQKVLSELFAAMTKDKRNDFDALMEQRGAEVVAHWKTALDKFFLQERTLKLPLNRIPVPRSSKQGVSLYSYALIYAMCLYQTEGCSIVVRDDEQADAEDLLAAPEATEDENIQAASESDEEEDEGADEPQDTAPAEDEDDEQTYGTDYRADALLDKPAQELRLSELKTSLDALLTEQGRNSLWNLLRESDPTTQRVIEARPAKHGMRIALGKRPCARFRAVLRKVRRDVKDRFYQGNFYDGCGFMDRELFDVLQEKLLGRKREAGEEPLNAVQIRLPWCKGLLVSFNAAEYFKAWAAEHGVAVQNLKIRDRFGCMRSVCDQDGKPLLRAVFTTAMFKGADWFEALDRLDGQQGEARKKLRQGERTPAGAPADRWAEYWRRLRAHRASMLIAGRSTKPGMTSRLNYQFISTLGLKKEELFRLIESRLHELGEVQQGVECFLPKSKASGEKAGDSALRGDAAPVTEASARAVDAGKPSEDAMSAEPKRLAGVRGLAGLLMGLSEQQSEMDDRENLMAMVGAHEADDNAEPGVGTELKNDSPDEDFSAGDAETHDFLTQFGRALVKYPEKMVGTELVRSRFNRLVHSEVLQMMRGRLPVHGDVRYLLPDLLQMVEHMARHFLRDADGKHLSIRKPAKDEEQAQDGKKPAEAKLKILPGINTLNPGNPYGYYYAPGKNDEVPWVKPAAMEETPRRLQVAILRNPHYAMGEEPIVAPLPEPVIGKYDKWFSHLTGCVMASSAVMYTINGADCDGDRVNVCSDTRIIKAIRRRAVEENKLLDMVIRNRDELVKWMKEQVNSDKVNGPERKYLELLIAELPQILPEATEKTSGKTEKSFMPPLIYTGSTAKSTSFSRQDLQGMKLKGRLWDSFCLTRRQRIGQMSLEVLKLVTDAYKMLPALNEDAVSVRLDDIAPAEAERSEIAGREQLLLGLFLARYLLICKALDTAMEIDMAKTGLTCDTHEIKRVEQSICRYFGYNRKSGFHAWLRLYKKNEKRLKGYSFDKTLEEMMTEFSGNWTAPDSGAALIDHLPSMVYALWAPDEARNINRSWALPAPREGKKELYRIRKDNLMSGSGGQIRARLRKPEKTTLDELQKSENGAPSLLDQIRDMVINYDQRRRISASGQEAAEKIAASYQAMVEWLLRGGSGLEEVLKDVRMLQCMLSRWYTNARAGSRLASGSPELLLRDVYLRLQDILRRQTIGISWGWGDDRKRRTLLEDALQASCDAVDPCMKAYVTCTEEEYALLTRGRRSQAFVCHVMTYAWYDAVLRELIDTGCAMPAEELEWRIRNVIANATPVEAIPDDPEAALAQQQERRLKERKLYYAACYQLYNQRYTDGAGRSRNMMSEFLMTFLLSDMLDRMLADAKK